MARDVECRLGSSELLALRQTVLLVGEDGTARLGLHKVLTADGYDVEQADTCRAALDRLRSSRPAALIARCRLPDGDALDLLPFARDDAAGIPCIVLAGPGELDLAAKMLEEGADQFLIEPVNRPALLLVLQRALENRRNRRRRLKEESVRGREPADPFLGGGTAIRELAEKARRVLDSERPVLIQGETGAGKGVLARWIHDHSPRGREPFVDLNCAGLSKEFLESELFGHERGAFTGAVNMKQGLFETAHRGTMFLDEIGDVDLQVQPKLLKVLEEQRFRRLGETRDRSVNVRLIAATHQNLREGEGGRRFREDLYFRISTIRLVIPPLRERPDDILPLSKQFLARFASELGRGEMELRPDAETALRRYTWPGNIRELRNVIERAVLLARSPAITERDLSFESHVTEAAMPNFDNLTLEEIEKLAVERALKLERGRVERAAARLGIARSSLYHRVQKFGIDLSRF